MSRPRLPDAVKAAKGTLQPCRVNKNAPKLDPAHLPPPPADLAADEAAIWVELAQVIDPMRVATAADVRCFRVLVYSVAISDRAQRNRKAGTVEKTLAHKAARAALADFGITPASRSKVSAAPPQEKASPFAKFLS